MIAYDAERSGRRSKEGKAMQAEPTICEQTGARGWLRRMAWAFALACAATCVAAAFAVAPAFAGWGSPVKVGENFGELERPVGVAVDQSTGDLYVGNLVSAQLDVFDLAHERIAPSPFGVGSGFYSGTALNVTNHHLYAVDALAQELDTYDPTTGELLWKFPVPGAVDIQGEAKFAAIQIASDAAGNVYVPEPENNRIGIFNEKGETPSGGVAEAIAGAGSNALSKPTGVAVDSAGNVWVADTGNNRIEEFEPDGAFVKEIASEGVYAVATDTSGDVFASAFASSGAQVFEYDSTGTQIEDFGQGVLGEGLFGEFEQPTPNGIIVDDTHHIVYVADGGNNVVWAFTKLPAVTTEAATGVTTTQATLHGTVDPGGEPLTSCEFEYALSTEYEPEHVYSHMVPCVQTPAEIGSGNAPVAVSAEISGLEVDGVYHFRLRASNEAGSAFGDDESFVAVEPVFGFQLGGPNALAALVSSEADEKVPAAASPTALDSQAGSHPFDVTTRFLINTEPNVHLPVDLQPKDYYVNIPAGFAGNIGKVPRCKMSDLSSLTNRQIPLGCPTASQVGVIRLFQGKGGGAPETEPFPVYNMAPPPGTPAELAFPYIEVGQPITFQLRSDGDYGVTANVHNISEAAPIIGSQLTLWGVPADPRHDLERFLPSRGSANNTEYKPGNEAGGPLPAGTAEVPFLTNPTRCGEQTEFTLTGDSWLHPGKLAEDGLPAPGGEGWVSVSTPMFPRGITGCEKLTFHPELEVKPTTTVADSPTGLTVDLRVPQPEGANNLATPALKDATVTLPQGVAISPSQANGLEGCARAQIKLKSMAQPECPNGSQVGKVEVTTPLLSEILTGQVYVGSERSGSTFHIYLVIRGNGILIKLEGTVHADERTGQLTSTFDENPQMPFSDLRLTFYGGENAALATPEACGSYQTTSLLRPWSDEPAPGEARGTPDAEPAAEPFQVSSGCVSGFAPSFAAGMSNPVAGAFSPFALSFSRNDGEEELSGLQLKLPPGLVAKLAGVAQCSDAQVAEAEHSSGAAEQSASSCPANSQVGTVQTWAGPGPGPFSLPGRAYLTGPYRGAPYGIAVIVPALAGPFDLGTVVVRSAIYIDAHSAQVTVVSDPLPRMLDGIPLKIRRVDVRMTRKDFTLDPTSCEVMRVAGTLTSMGGHEDPVASRFQVGDCASLEFRPGFKVTTHAHHSRRNGAYLRVGVTSGPGQANIGSVHVQLPKALPSRLSTLKEACSEKQFEQDPAACPAASHVGTAIAHTPILSVPLTGPAIFVSHGGAEFPDLDVVLQGAGITVELTGNTSIHKDVTNSDFRSLPDVPVDSFQLTLSEGPHSALSAPGNLCFKTVRRHKRRLRLTMPTTITGQNGAVVKQDTVAHVEGCGKTHGKRKGR
jgi:NHL repeat